MKFQVVCILMLSAMARTGYASPFLVPSIRKRNTEEPARPIPLNRDVDGRITLESMEGSPEEIYYANRNQYPFMVAIFKFKENGFRFTCGGSLITANQILTAAHCLTDNRTKSTTTVDQLKVKLGMHFLNATSDDAQLTVNISHVKIHEDYNPKTKLNDIAILTLESKVEFNEAISPVCLMPNDYYDYQDLFTTMGWINTSSEWNNTDYLWHSKAVLWPNAVFQEVFAELGVKLTNNMFVAFWSEEYVCRDDDGSPVVVELRNASGANWQGGCRDMQVGIVSIGHGCLKMKLGGIYTRVEVYMPWIKANAPDIAIATLPIRETENPGEIYVTIDPQL